MTTSKNDITGDKIQSRTVTKAFEEGFERIFGKKEEPKNSPVEKEIEDSSQKIGD